MDFGSMCYFFIILKLVSKIITLSKEETEQKRLQDQIKRQYIYLEEAKKRNEQYRMFQHDINNHFLVLSGLIREKNYNKAKEYFKYLNQKDYKYIDDIEKIVQISEFLEKKLPQHYNSLKTIIDEENHHYTIEVFQILGNFIRDRLELEANKQEKV